MKGRVFSDMKRRAVDCRQKWLIGKKIRQHQNDFKKIPNYLCWTRKDLRFLEFEIILSILGYKEEHFEGVEKNKHQACFFLLFCFHTALLENVFKINIVLNDH